MKTKKYLKGIGFCGVTITMERYEILEETPTEVIVRVHNDKETFAKEKIGEQHSGWDSSVNLPVSVYYFIDEENTEIDYEFVKKQLMDGLEKSIKYKFEQSMELFDAFAKISPTAIAKNDVENTQIVAPIPIKGEICAETAKLLKNFLSEYNDKEPHSEFN